MDTILVVEDELENRQIYKTYVASHAERLHMKVDIREAASFEEAEKRLEQILSEPKSTLVLILLDMELPLQRHKNRRAGYELMRRYRQNFPTTLWIPLSATLDLNKRELPSQLSLFEELYALQPFAVLTKVNIEELENVVYKALKSIQELTNKQDRQTRQTLSETVIHFRDSSSSSPQEHFYVTQNYELFRQIRLVASTQRHVLLFGERGTGKTLTAHLIHHYSAQRKQPFKTIDGLLDEETLEDSLFPKRDEQPGDDQRSLLGQAHNGTLYISDFDQMGAGISKDVTYKLHGRLLHFIRYRNYNVRIIGGITHAQRGFALNESILPAFSKSTVSLELLPLRERKADIPDLVRLCVQQFNQEHAEAGGVITGQLPVMDEEPKRLMDEEPIYELLKQQNWQDGNISQLRKLVDDVLLNALTSIITVDDFQRALQLHDSGSSLGTITELSPHLRRGFQDESERQTKEKLPKSVKAPVVITVDDLRKYGL
jgi:DNA-binding NtrC family response regulator